MEPFDVSAQCDVYRIVPKPVVGLYSPTHHPSKGKKGTHMKKAAVVLLASSPYWPSWPCADRQRHRPAAARPAAQAGTTPLQRDHP